MNKNKHFEIKFEYCSEIFILANFNFTSIMRINRSFKSKVTKLCCYKISRCSSAKMYHFCNPPFLYLSRSVFIKSLVLFQRVVPPLSAAGCMYGYSVGKYIAAHVSGRRKKSNPCKRQHIY